MTLQDTQVAQDRSLEKLLEKPIRFVFAGRTDTAKGLGRSLEILKGVTQYSGDVHFDVLGDGPERPKFEQMTGELGLTEKVTFRGWVPHGQIPDYLARSHFMLLPSTYSEGWPKVLSEAMSYGTVPIASNVSAIPQILDQTKAGLALPADDIDGMVRAIVDIMGDPPKWKEMSLAGIEAAPRFSYERYLTVLDEMFNLAYGWSPLRHDVVMELRQKMKVVQNESFAYRQ